MWDSQGHPLFEAVHAPRPNEVYFHAQMELVPGFCAQLYKKWNQTYCKGQILRSVGLQDEAYFKYFDYKDFVTPSSGLIQIRKYAEVHNTEDLLKLFEKISAKTKEVREEIYRLLVKEFGYFE